jgi:hypothetical protein
VLGRWRLGVRATAAAEIEEEELGLDADGGRAVPTVDGGLGRTVPGGRPTRAVLEVDEVVVGGRETGGLLLAWERGYWGVPEAAAAAAAEGMGEVGCGGGLRRTPVDSKEDRPDAEREW